jgi:hypothetical protein
MSTQPASRRTQDRRHARDIFPLESGDSICEPPKLLAHGERRFNSRLGGYDSQRCDFPARPRHATLQAQEMGSAGHLPRHQLEPEAGPPSSGLQRRAIPIMRPPTPYQTGPSHYPRPHIWRDPAPSATPVLVPGMEIGNELKSYFDITPPKHRFRDTLQTLRKRASRFASNLGFGRDKSKDAQVAERQEPRIRSNHRSLPSMRQQLEGDTVLTPEEARLVPPLPPLPLRHRVTFDDFGRQLEPRSFAKPRPDEVGEDCRGKGNERKM